MSRGLVAGYALLAVALGVVGFSEPLMVDLRLPVSFMILAAAAGFYLVAELQRVQRQLDEAKDDHLLEPPDLALLLVQRSAPPACQHLARVVSGVCAQCGRPVS